MDTDLSIYKNIKFPETRRVHSSAGSGKTFALTARYIQLLLLYPEINIGNIFASTFTNKAASEMKNRIILRLKKLAIGQDAGEMDFFKSITTLSEEGIKNRADKILNDILLNYSDFEVRTIDSFMDGLLKSFAVELGLPPNMDIQKGIEEHIHFIIDSMVDEIPENDEIRKDFSGFVENYLKIEKKESWMPVDRLKVIMEKFYKDELIRSENIKYIRGYEESLRRILKSNEDEIRNGISKIGEFKEYINKNAYGALEKFLNGNISGASKSVMWQRTCDIIILKKAPNEQRKIICDLWGKIKEKFFEYVGAYLRMKLAYYTMLLGKFRERFERYKKEQGVIFIDELSKYVSMTRNADMPVPFIYWKLGEVFRHFLIDEFQDTSEIQWNNIKPLVEETLSKEGTLFIVGDTKQAIYRWRGGRAELFKEADNFPSVPEENRLSLTLIKNYRSRRNIVEFNNTLFQEICNANTMYDDIVKGINPLKNIYKDVKQELPEREGGYIYIEDIGKWNKGVSTEHIEKAFKTLMEDIIGRHNLSDIAVLVRKNRQASIVVEWLGAMDIPGVSAESAWLATHPLIKEIESFLKFLNNPMDNIAFASFITGDIFTRISGISREEIYKFLELAGNNNIYSSFKERYNSEWNTLIAPLFKSAHWLPPYSLIQEIYHRYNIINHFPDAEAFLMEFLEVSSNFEASSPISIGEFIDFWEGARAQNSTNVKLPDGLNAVRVITVHKAKGLEFPVVVIPFTLDDIIDVDPAQKTTEGSEMNFIFVTKDFINIDEAGEIYTKKALEQIVDETNILYVAFTRPRDELYVILSGKQKHTWTSILRKTVMENEKFAAFKQDENKIIIGNPAQSKVNIPPPKQRRIMEISKERNWENLLYRKTEKLNTLINPEERYAVERGKILHYALSLIPSLPEKGWEREVENAAALAVYQMVPPTERKEWMKQIKEAMVRIFSLEKVKEWFFLPPDASVWQEKEIADAAGKIKRPDRIIIYPEKIILIDYKTGKEKKSEYGKQIKDYVKILSEYFPNKSISAYILYTERLEVEKQIG